MTTEQLLHKIQTLSPEHINLIADFVVELDSDSGLKEDIAEMDERIQELEKNNFANLIPLELVQKDFKQNHPEFK